MFQKLDYWIFFFFLGGGGRHIFGVIVKDLLDFEEKHIVENFH